MRQVTLADAHPVLAGVDVLELQRGQGHHVRPIRRSRLGNHLRVDAVAHVREAVCDLGPCRLPPVSTIRDGEGRIEIARVVGCVVEVWDEVDGYSGGREGLDEAGVPPVVGSGRAKG